MPARGCLRATMPRVVYACFTHALTSRSLSPLAQLCGGADRQGSRGGHLLLQGGRGRLLARCGSRHARRSQYRASSFCCATRVWLQLGELCGARPAPAGGAVALMMLRSQTQLGGVVALSRCAGLSCALHLSRRGGQRGGCAASRLRQPLCGRS
jgi:hypothetical protein